MALLGYPLPTPQMPTSWVIIVIAGFLVGLEHGSAAGARRATASAELRGFRLRSIVATATFMGAAIIVVAVMRHGFGG